MCTWLYASHCARTLVFIITLIFHNKEIETQGALCGLYDTSVPVSDFCTSSMVIWGDFKLCNVADAHEIEDV